MTQPEVLAAESGKLRSHLEYMMELHDRLEEEFRQVFDNEDIKLADDMMAPDIEG